MKFDGIKVQSNIKELKRIRSIFFIFLAIFVAFFNIGGMWGFLAYFVEYFLFNQSITWVIGEIKIKDCFQDIGNTSEGIFSDFSWYLLIWTTFYNLIHVI